MSTNANKDDISTKLAKYDEFLNKTLNPDLKKTLDERDVLRAEVQEYNRLLGQIKTIRENDLKELKSLVDIGSNFYVQAKVPDTSHIYVNVEPAKEPVHVRFTLDEATTFIVNRNARSEKQIEALTTKANQIRAHIQMVLEATAEIMRLEKSP